MKMIKQHHYRKVEEAIIEELQSISAEWNGGSPKIQSELRDDSSSWTKAIFKKIDNVKSRIDFGSFAERVTARSAGKLHSSSEWLWDITWRWETSSELGKQTVLNGLYLACESELAASKSSILDDFHKLLVADAKIRIFVFARSRNSIEKTDGHLKLLEEAIQSYWNGLGKNRLLVAVWDYNATGQKFLFWRYNTSLGEFIEV